MPVPLAALSAAIVGSNTTEGMDFYIVSAVCCQVEVSATSWSLVRKIRTDCGVSFYVI
jgi:hypothetical protein